MLARCSLGWFVCLDFVKKFKDRHAQCIGDHLHGVQRRIGLAVLDSAEVGLIKAAFFAKLDLTHASRKSQRSHARTKLLSQRDIHKLEYLSYALNHIHTNSYIQGRQCHDEWQGD